MRYLSKIQIEELLNSNHGGEGLFRIWDEIINYFPNISYEECKAEFLSLIEYLLTEKIIKLCGVWTDKENTWDGSIENILVLIKNWFPNETDWNFREDASFKMFDFDYPFIKWLKDAPIKLTI
jgi:hypothetical protein